MISTRCKLIFETIGFLDFTSLGFPEGWSHCQLPSICSSKSSQQTVYFASRNSERKSSIYKIKMLVHGSDVTFKTEEFNSQPVLEPSTTGHFDSDGVFPSCVFEHENQLYLYYIGWLKGARAPLFHANIGLARENSEGKFERMSPVPHLGWSKHDPLLVTSPNILKFPDGRCLMGYTSGIAWTETADGTLSSKYNIKTCISKSYFNWEKDGKFAFELNEGETNVARPSFLRQEDGNILMFYSYVNEKTRNYRIGYAKSRDLMSWKRCDEDIKIKDKYQGVVQVSAYPCVFRQNENIYLLYNGMHYGKDGFYIAMLTHE